MAAEKKTSLDRVYHLVGNAEWRHLLDYLDFLEGFGVIVVLAPEQAGADVCRRALRNHYAKKDRTLHRVRLHLREAPGALGDHLLDHPLPEDTAAIWVDAPEPASATADEPIRELWRLALSALNPRRNPLRRQLSVPLIFAGPMWLQEVFREAAPDIWSIRETVARIEPHSHGINTTELADVNMETSGRSVEGEPGNPEETRQALVKLRRKKVPASHRKEKSAVEAHLLHRLGNQLRRQFQWNEAEDALLEADQLMEKNPRCVEDQMNLFNDLCLLSGAQGNRNRAEHYARKAYETANAHFGQYHRSTLTCRNNLALTLWSLGKHAEAEMEHRAVLDIREHAYGSEDPDTLQSRNNLGIALGIQGKHSEHEKEARTVLAIRERLFGPEHPDTLQSRSNLAVALGAQGKHAEAEKEEREVIAIQKRVLGQKHPDFLRSSSNLAVSLQKLGKLKEAFKFARQARDGRRAVLGVEHPDFESSQKLCERIEVALKEKKKARK